MLIPCYYLLYKLTNCEILWIIMVTVDYNEVKSRIKNFSSRIEQYLIVSKHIDEDELYKKFKQFTRFRIDKKCLLLERTR